MARDTLTGNDESQWGECGLVQPAVSSSRSSILSFAASSEELAAECVEIGEHRSLVTFAPETGLRPCEWLALERRDVDKEARRVYVEREHVEGVTKAYGKTTASRRAVPLTQKALDALEALAPRIDSPLLFPAGCVLRHTFASNALAVGVGTFELARYMGTSLEMIDGHYGHLTRGADDAFRSKLDPPAAGRSGVEVVSASEGGS